MEELKILFVYIYLFPPMPSLNFKAPNNYVNRINICSSTGFVGEEQQHVIFEFMRLNCQVPPVLLRNKDAELLLLISGQLIDDFEEQVREQSILHKE